MEDRMAAADHEYKLVFYDVLEIGTCNGGLAFPRKKPTTSTARGVSRFRAMYIGILTPARLARANATLAL